MFGSVWRFIKRHRRKIVVTGAVVGGIVLLGKYAQHKLKEFQDQEAAEYIAHVKKEHHFEGNQRTCNSTVISMIPALRDAVRRALHTEELTALLKTKPDNKLDIWEELKVKSFTRTLVSVYTSCILVCVLRVKLNIIGGYIFVDSILNRGELSEEAAVASESVQRHYLEAVHYVMDKGLDDLIATVLKATDTVIRDMDLRSKLSLSDVEDIIKRVRRQVEQSQENGYCDVTGGDVTGSSALCRFMMPHCTNSQAAGAVCRDDVILDRLSHETRDILENCDFHRVLSLSLDHVFNQLLDHLADHYNQHHLTEQTDTTDTGGATSSSPDQFETQIALAKLIPVIDGMVHVVLSDMPNPFIKDQLLMEEGRLFAANVYEAFSHVDRTAVR